MGSSYHRGTTHFISAPYQNGNSAISHQDRPPLHAPQPSRPAKSKRKGRRPTSGEAIANLRRLRAGRRHRTRIVRARRIRDRQRCPTRAHCAPNHAHEVVATRLSTRYSTQSAGITPPTAGSRPEPSTSRLGRTRSHRSARTLEQKWLRLSRPGAQVN